MTPAELLSSLEREGVRLSLNDAGALRCRGDRAKVEARLPLIREHKPALLAALAQKLAAFEDEPAAPAGAEPAAEPGAVPDLSPPDPESLAAWDHAGELIRAGWRAEFSPPGPDGKQHITWIPPGEWTPAPIPSNSTELAEGTAEAHQGEPSP